MPAVAAMPPAAGAGSSRRLCGGGSSEGEGSGHCGRRRNGSRGDDSDRGCRSMDKTRPETWHMRGAWSNSIALLRDAS